MTKKQLINIASFQTDSWPVAIRPARLRKPSKPNRAPHLAVLLAFVSGGATKPVAAREVRMVIL